MKKWHKMIAEMKKHSKNGDRYFMKIGAYSLAPSKQNMPLVLSNTGNAPHSMS